MDSARTHGLARFCADQYFGFEPEAWRDYARSNEPALLAAAARYLSMTSWYGRAEVLTDLAGALEDPGCQPVRSASGAVHEGFDLEAFSAALRVAIASRRLLASHKAVAWPVSTPR